jgi:hypothetical protein
MFLAAALSRTFARARQHPMHAPRLADGRRAMRFVALDRRSFLLMTTALGAGALSWPRRVRAQDRRAPDPLRFRPSGAGPLEPARPARGRHHGRDLLEPDQGEARRHLGLAAAAIEQVDGAPHRFHAQVGHAVHRRLRRADRGRRQVPRSSAWPIPRTNRRTRTIGRRWSGSRSRTRMPARSCSRSRSRRSGRSASCAARAASCQRRRSSRLAAGLRPSRPRCPAPTC